MTEQQPWYRVEPNRKDVSQFGVITKIDIQRVPERSGAFGGATYGYNLTYKTEDYIFRITSGRTLGGSGKAIYFKLYRGEKIIAADAIFGERAEVFACLLYNLLK